MRMRVSELRRLIETVDNAVKFDAAWTDRINYGSLDDLVSVMDTPNGREYTLQKLADAGVTFPVTVYHAPIAQDRRARYQAWSSDIDVVKSFMDEINAPYDQIQTRVLRSADPIIAYHPYEDEYVLYK